MIESEVIVVGGGLSGLYAACGLAREGVSVTLFEKKTYPRHRVCGEFLSMESVEALQELGLGQLKQAGVQISDFILCDHFGRKSAVSLPKDSLGISRYALEFDMYQLALKYGVELHQSKEIHDVNWQQEEQLFIVRDKHKHQYKAKLVIGAFGKQSNLQVSELERTEYFAAKNYYKADFKSNEVRLNLFEGGYLGLSKVETGLINCCYLGKVSDLKKSGSIEQYQKDVLEKNPYLKSFFRNATQEWEKPITISRIYFGPRNQVNDHRLVLGDAAGMIFPLSGSGMSIAIHSAHEAVQWTLKFLNDEISRIEMEKAYQTAWQRSNGVKVQMGRYFQSVMEHKKLSALAVPIVGMPYVGKKIISMVNG